MTRRPRFLAFEGFRTALARLAEGLIRVGPPADESNLRDAEARLRRPLPASLRTFLRSFDGADLFHESLLIGGVGPEAPASLVGLAGEANTAMDAGTLPGDLVVARAATGDVFVLEAATPDRPGERVFRVPSDTDECWLAGSTFETWLDAFVAAEQLLYDSSGEFVLDAFEPDGELVPIMAVRQAERAVRKDPGAADRHFDLGVARRRLDQLDQAASAFARAAELQPDNPWPWFDQGRVLLTCEEPARAASCFVRAAEATTGPERARMLAWVARAWLLAGKRGEAEQAVASARAADPAIVAQLQRAAEAAETGEDPGAAAEARALLAAFEPGGLARRLPVLPSAPAAEPRRSPSRARSRPPR